MEIKMNLILTREWLTGIEKQINDTVLGLIEEANNNRVLVGLDPLKFKSPSLNTVVNMIGSLPKTLSAAPVIEQMFEDTTKSTLPDVIQIPNVMYEVSDGNCMEMTLYLAWYKGYYRAEGILIKASQYEPFAEELNYRICVEADEGYPNIAANLTVWYVNDFDKNKAAPKLMVGSRNYHRAMVNIGRGSDEALNLHNTPSDIRFGIDVMKYYKVDGDESSEVELPFFEI